VANVYGKAVINVDNGKADGGTKNRPGFHLGVKRRIDDDSAAASKALRTDSDKSIKRLGCGKPGYFRPECLIGRSHSV
ncbi:hypothetical protein BGZ99_006093, partial [Dissophora globulifera]